MSTPSRRRTRRRAPSVEERRRVLEEEQRNRKRAAAPTGPLAEATPTLVTAALAVIGLAIYLFARRASLLDFPPYELGVALGIVLGTLYALAIFQVLGRHGHPRTGLALLLRGVIVLLAVAGASFATLGLLTLLNVTLDRAPATVHRALVVEKSLAPGASGQFTAVRAEWAGDVFLTVNLPESAFDQIEPRRSYVVVRTHSGAFGWKWIEGSPDVETPPPPTTPESPIAAEPSALPTGAASVAEGDRTEAREVARRALEQLRAGAHDLGIADLKRAIDLDPYYTSAYSELEKALLPQRDYDTIAEYWGKLVSINPESRDGWYGRARTRMAQNDETAALQDSTEACKLGHLQACVMAETLRGL
jgi:tetratricopeptide (TPR) repeat protein